MRTRSLRLRDAARAGAWMRATGLRRIACLIPVAAASLLASGSARAVTSLLNPLPNVLLLIDTSGSMELMPDGSKPEDDLGTTCAPGVETLPNRWGIVVQSLTGSLQPFYSCAAMSRAAGLNFDLEYGIVGGSLYDLNYFLPYHRPLTGDSGPGGTDFEHVCAIGPYKLPGVANGSGVGPEKLGTGGNAYDFPSDAIATYRWDKLSAITAGHAADEPNKCTFDQASDGQLDLSRDFVRFALMTFDNDPDPGIGVTPAPWPTAGGVAANPFLGQWSYIPAAGDVLGSGVGQLPGCGTTTSLELGARNWGAPPWEGRLIPFAPESADTTDIEGVNDNIQLAINTMRPYGATPLAGMFNDARDYLWLNPIGPYFKDASVAGGCRDQYVVLLTDGAPNLDLRPNCEAAGGTCPYDKTKDIIADLAAGTGHHPVKTFVIGFSVNGTAGTGGFPAAYPPPLLNNCAAWFAGAGGTGLAMSTACTAAGAGTTFAQPGSTAAACCALNELAYNGTTDHASGNDHAFFVESQADLNTAFAAILGSLGVTVTTRTIPASSPGVTAGGTTSAADFVASFIPSAIGPWSGDIQRTRTTCDSGSGTLKPELFDPAQGDDFAANLSSSIGNRYFITVVPNNTQPGSGRDGSLTIRPYIGSVSNVPTGDGLPVYLGQEVLITDSNFSTLSSYLDADALNIDDKSCKKSRDAMGTTIPKLNANDCEKVAWGFATAKDGLISLGTPAYNFNVRCNSPGSPWTRGTNVAGPGGCTALGAIYHSSPAVVAPPASLLRDEGYRAFAARTGVVGRAQTVYVASTDGLLHAFRTGIDTTLPTVPTKNEEWAFIPPAALPLLLSNWPSGQQMILDGAPVVKDVVWDRARADISSDTMWHTALVASLGAQGGGYYALDVSADGALAAAGDYQAATPAGGLTALNTAIQTKKGPHFLWQLTEVPDTATTHKGKKGKKGKGKGEGEEGGGGGGGGGVDQLRLFGAQTATPAIATLYFDPAATGSAESIPAAREIGVAILPGGLDGPPIAGQTCPRTTATSASDLGPFVSGFPNELSPAGFAPRTVVRRWSANCTDPIPGRSLTIVRLDNGQIVRHFGRVQDTPSWLDSGGTVIPTAIDSPMTGTPLVYPADVGSVAQKIFVADADGTIYRFDVSSTNPNNWKGRLFYDTQNTTASGRSAAQAALDGQPIIVAPVAALDPTGKLVLTFATGDQEIITDTSPSFNFVVSLLETPTTDGTAPVQAGMNWYLKLANGERVTGPMAIFDKTLYFATFLPSPGASACGAAHAYLHGMDYVNARPLAGEGGVYLFPPGPTPAGSCEPAVAGDCYDATVPLGAIIPGVSIRATLACATQTAITDVFGGTHWETSNETPTSYYLFAGVAGKVTGPGTSVSTTKTMLSIPKTLTSVDAWAAIVE